MRHRLILLAPALAAALLAAGCGSSSSSPSSPTTAAAASAPAGSAGVQVKTATDAALGGAVLVDSRGMTLYHLTGETVGRFICTGACLKIWHPLIASGGSSPSGTVASLGTVTRADGTVQVTFKGEPLYTFVKDASPGQATGQGIKDVGTWTAVPASAQKAGTPSSPPPATTQSPPSSSGSGGGGY
jgi:predicted lipoprotein with Yx(FWY)xxD motif